MRRLLLLPLRLPRSRKADLIRTQNRARIPGIEAEAGIEGGDRYLRT
jgi:hypothetical protein